MIDYSKEITRRMLALKNPEEAMHLMRFFKCGPGEYGEGDAFLGIRVPCTRKIVAEFKADVSLADILQLTDSQWHEVRLAGFLLMIELFKKSMRSDNPKEAKEIVDTYLKIIPKGNNWDLVDLIAPKILGSWLLKHPEDKKMLTELSLTGKTLWHKRVAIVACWTLIRDGSFSEALEIAERYINHPHDLIHKASGWMLREIGKRGGMMELIAFLDRNASRMPRTMLRYSMEKLPQDLRMYYLSLPRIR